MKQFMLFLVVLLPFALIGPPPCLPQVEDKCGDRKDNDGDGLVDCDDTDDCVGSPDTIIFNEFQPNPAVVEPETARSLELFNTSSERCVDVSGWELQSSDTGILTQFPLGTRIPPNDYYLIAGSLDPVKNCGIIPDLQFFEGNTMVPTQDWFELLDGAEIRASGQYINTCPVGRSLEVCEEGDSLHCSEIPYGDCDGNYGTPGAPNGC